MKLIVDAGSTKTLWYVCPPHATITQYSSTGCNPSTMSVGQLSARLQGDWLPALGIAPLAVETIHFYGAGCGSAAARAALQTVLSSVFEYSQTIDIQTDMMAAGRALLGDGAGICAILGTGSNAGYYAGGEIQAQTATLGYVLGDEGGGCDLGKRLLRSYFYGLMPKHLCNLLAADTQQLHREQVLKQVYQEAAPNAYLASFVPFILKHREEPFIQMLLEQSFSDFFDYQLQPLLSLSDSLYFVGSVAHYFADELQGVAGKKGYTIKKILQTPFPELLYFHIKNIDYHYNPTLFPNSF